MRLFNNFILMLSLREQQATWRGYSKGMSFTQFGVNRKRKIPLCQV